MSSAAVSSLGSTHGSGSGSGSGAQSGPNPISTPESEHPTTPTRPLSRRPARVYRNSDGQPSSPIGTTYSPGGTAQDPTAATTVAAPAPAPDRPQTPETPDGTGESRRRLREGSAAIDVPGWNRSGRSASDVPLFARVQRASLIQHTSVTFIAGPPGTMTVIAVQPAPLSFGAPLPQPILPLDDPFGDSSPRPFSNPFVDSLLTTTPPPTTPSPPPTSRAKRSREDRSPPSPDWARKRWAFN
ncbi:hypothetical protein DL98DRAFT_591067 [Cadophora sp. DSE1049]|nr:hypothetical protein DL98DRAFT_591067 [Cadophora sp. DSE1049]